MLNFDEFVEYIKSNVISQLGYSDEEYSVYVSKVKKSNCILTGLCVMPLNKVSDDEIIAASTIYLEPFFEDIVKHHLSKEEALKSISDRISSADTKGVANMDFSFNEPEKHLSYRLLSRSSNEELLKTVPHRDFLDLAVILTWRFDRFENSTPVMVITYDNLKLLKKTEQELFEIARINVPKCHPVIVGDLCDILRDYASPDDLGASESCNMKVISNPERLDGAAVMFYEDTKIWESLCHEYGSDFLILPSSRNEIITLPCSNSFGSIDTEEVISHLEEMVADVNDSFCEPSEVLSYSIYKYTQGVGFSVMSGAVACE